MQREMEENLERGRMSKRWKERTQEINKEQKRVDERNNRGAFKISDTELSSTFAPPCLHFCCHGDCAVWEWNCGNSEEHLQPLTTCSSARYPAPTLSKLTLTLVQ